MKRKHAITTAVVVLVLGALVYTQIRHWRTFDWHEFWRQTSGVNVWSILFAIGLIYAVYALRAVRWMIFLRPKLKTDAVGLIPSQFIGFTGLALLGRPGEFIRPYLVARKVKLSFASQLAVWAVERVFDIGSVALLLGGMLALRGGKYRDYPQVETAGIAMLALAAFVSLTVFLLWWRTDFISSTLEKMLKSFSKKIANMVCHRVRSFGEGLHTIRDFRSFVAILLLSLFMWICVAEAYIHVLHAYPEMTVTQERVDDHGRPLPPKTKTVRLHEMHLEDVFLVMGASMLGSVVQLPGVGGGSQLAVISLLSSNIFQSEPYNTTPELATSCGIMLWLVTFMSVIPAGLALAHRSGISLRALSAESETEASDEESATE